MVMMGESIRQIWVNHYQSFAGGRTTDYWIISTDYTSYSVVYGCQKQGPTGGCAEPMVWVWTRTPAGLLHAGQAMIVDDVLRTLCVNKSAFLETDQTDGELGHYLNDSCPCNVLPLKPHFYIAKLGMQGYTYFSYFCSIDCWYSLEPPRRGGSNVYPQSMF